MMIWKIYRERLVVFISLALYPLWFMSPILFGDMKTTMTHGVESDINGAYLNALIFERMTWPWSRNMMLNAPLGESFWTITSASQALNYIPNWLFTRVLDPFDSVALFHICGWILTGVAVYLLARHLKVGKVPAVCGGLFCEMLPWIRERVLAHTSYVWLGVPLIVILLALRFVANPNKRSFWSLATALTAVLFFDLYWFWFSFWAVVLICLMSSDQLMPSVRKWKLAHQFLLLLSPLVCGALGVIAYRFINLQLSESGSLMRPLAVASRQDVNEYNGSLLRFIRPDYAHLLFPRAIGATPPHDDVNYGGFIVIALSVFGFGLALARRSRAALTIVILSLFFALLTLQTGNILGIVEIFRYLMPGVRRFSRAGMVVEGLLCVMASYCVGIVFNKIAIRRSMSLLFLIVLMCAVFIDLNPPSRRYVNHDVSNWSSINLVLSTFDRPIVVQLSPQNDGGYFPIHYLDAPQIRTPHDLNWLDNVQLHASLGIQDFVSYLHSMGVTHVIVSKSDFESGSLHYRWGTASSTDIDLTDMRFTKRAESDGEVPAVLLQLRPAIGDSHCSSCKPYKLEWISVRPDFYTVGRAEYNATHNIQTDVSWALPSDDVSFRVVPMVNTIAKYKATISFVPAFGGNAPPQVLSVQSGADQYAVQLSAGMNTDLTLLVASGEQISVHTVLPCAQVSKVEPGNPDTRTLCFGISAIRIQQL